MIVPDKKKLLKLIKSSYKNIKKCKPKNGKVDITSFDIFLYKKDGFYYKITISVPPSVDTVEKFFLYKEKIVPTMIQSMRSQVNKYGSNQYIDVANKNQLFAQSFGDYSYKHEELKCTIDFPLS